MGTHEVEPEVVACRLQDADADARLRAARALGAMHPHSARQAPALARRLSDIGAGSGVAQGCAEALSRLGEAGASALAGSLEHPDAEVRLLAVETLALMKKYAEPHAPAIAMLLADLDDRVRNGAQWQAKSRTLRRTAHPSSIVRVSGCVARPASGLPTN